LDKKTLTEKINIKMNTNGTTKTIYEIIDGYFNNVILGIHIISFLIEIILIIIYLLYCSKKNIQI
jgi:hypothetical protein